ncbi:MAG TPA: biotin transporter BioY [Gemmatimonadales bacterium]|nr:biotin transporter BioY [Gemmatimonadales bacterium]
MTLVSSAAERSPARARARAAASVLAGVLLVALASQLAVPLPGTPVPLTLQPLAVLLVGGLLGPLPGAAAMVLYLALGAAGLPVFTPFGAPGLLRLLGPTGGYLLAFPVAAAVVGWVTARGTGWLRLLAGPLLGMVAIHAGGLAQLVALTGSARAAFAAGVVPFALGDALKVLVAALVLRRAAGRTRALG